MFRHGEDFELVEDVATLDADALDTLLASSYGQQMFDGGETKGAIRGDYIAELASRSPKVYLATSGPNAEYAACAIVTECLAGSEVPYLCKFAVSEAAQGTGVADALWSRVKAEHADGLYWRSHAHSPINPWFFQVNIYIYPFVITERYDKYCISPHHHPFPSSFSQRAEGTYRADVDAPDVAATPPWTVFWYGSGDLSDGTMQTRVEAAMARGRSFYSDAEV